MTQFQLLQEAFNQMDNMFTSNEIIKAFTELGGDTKYVKHKLLKFVKSNAVPEDPFAQRARTWVKKESDRVDAVIGDFRLIDYLRDNNGAEEICIGFLKQKGYRILKQVEVEL